MMMMECNSAVEALAKGCRGASREVCGWPNFSCALPSGQAPRGSALPLLPPTRALQQPRYTRRPRSGPRQPPSSRAPPWNPSPPSPEKGFKPSRRQDRSQCSAKESEADLTNKGHRWRATLRLPPPAPSGASASSSSANTELTGLRRR